LTRTRRSRFWFALATALVAVTAGMLAACEQGSEGDRCNPDLVNTTECNSGLACVTPSSCVISVCCPSAPPYSDPQCECFAHPEGCACSVDAAYDTGVAADAGVVDATASDAGKDGSQ